MIESAGGYETKEGKSEYFISLMFLSLMGWNLLWICYVVVIYVDVCKAYI